MIAIRSIVFGDVITVSYADRDELREFAMVTRTLVLDPAAGDYAELVTAADDAIRALLVDVLEDISLTEPMTEPMKEAPDAAEQ